MQRTDIQYLTHTCNPIKMRCTPVSAGCANCWHLRYCDRMKNNYNFTKSVRDAYKGKTPILDYDELRAPLLRKKPARIGLQFMGDLLHGLIDGFVISSIWGVMKDCPWHTFFILTKRPERFLKLTPSLPILENVWLGISVEDQKTADERIPVLLQIPAAHRWISYEPGLGLIDIKWAISKNRLDIGAGFLERGIFSPGMETLHPLNFVVAGGETGPKARPMHPDWVRSIRDQCHVAGVPFFFKSWGDRVHNSHPYFDNWNCDRGKASYWIGHKKAGRLLDGQEYSEMP